MTPQRLEIFREIAGSRDHPDAEAVYHAVRRRVPTVSPDTVYRTLWMLQDLGLIQTLGARRRSVRFDANLEHHHHFVCTRCGLTRDFLSAAFDALGVPESLRELGTVTATHVEARGLCRDCQESTAPQQADQTEPERRSGTTRRTRPAVPEHRPARQPDLPHDPPESGRDRTSVPSQRLHKGRRRPKP